MMRDYWICGSFRAGVERPGALREPDHLAGFFGLGDTGQRHVGQGCRKAERALSSERQQPRLPLGVLLPHGRKGAA